MWTNNLPSSSITLLRNLTLGQQVEKVVGLVIAKKSPRIVEIKDDKNKKIVFTFTLRDSEHDFINVTCWFIPQTVTKMTSAFEIGDVVLVRNALVQPKHEGSFAERCLVQTPSLFTLSLNERRGRIEQYRELNRDYFATLECMLTFPPSDHVTIGQIVQYAQSALTTKSASQANKPKMEYFTFFAVVCNIEEPREVFVQGQPKTVCEVTLADETCSAFPLTLWNDEWLSKATTSWFPKVTTLSVVDCRVKWDTYKRGVVGSADGRTIIVTNPDTYETRRLYQYAQSDALVTSATRRMGKQGLEQTIQEGIPLSSIHTVVTVESMKNRQIACGYGIVFAVLSQFDIDGSLWNFTRTRCTNCSSRVLQPLMTCNSFNCPMLGKAFTGLDDTSFKMEYSTIVHLSDHTGTSLKCWLGGDVMEKALSMSVENLVAMTTEQRSHLKWEFLLRRFKIYFRSSLPSFDNPDPYISILAMVEPDYFEVMTSLRET